VESLSEPFKQVSLLTRTFELTNWIHSCCFWFSITPAGLGIWPLTCCFIGWQHIQLRGVACPSNCMFLLYMSI
jgi:hypothetical protein